MGTAILAAVISLDGDGTTTYMIIVASMLPLYKRLGLNSLNLTCVTILAGGVMNLTPWGGPLARAATALQVDPSDVFVPMVPAMVVGVLAVIALAYLLGMRERRRLGMLTLAEAPLQAVAAGVPVSVQQRERIGERRLLLRRIAGDRRGGADLRHRARGNGARLVDRPTRASAEPAGPTYLLVGLAAVEFGDHQRYTLWWAVLISLTLMAMALLCAVFPLVSL